MRTDGEEEEGFKEEGKEGKMQEDARGYESGEVEGVEQGEADVKAGDEVYFGKKRGGPSSSS